MPAPDRPGTASISIQSPREGEKFIGQSVQLGVSGTVKADPGVHIEKVTVQFGEGGLFRSAILDGEDWTFTRPIPESIDPLRITAKVSVTFPGGTGSSQDSRSVSVIVDYTPPTLRAEIPERIEYVGPLNSFLLSGAATDIQTGVKAVELQVDSGPWLLAEDISGGWGTWRIFVSLPDAGEYEIALRATDNLDNSHTISKTVTASDTRKPIVSITQPPEDSATVTFGHEVNIAGTATDAGSGVGLVEWWLSTDDSENPRPARNDSGDWSNWSVSIPPPGPGTHQVVVRAVDNRQNQNSATRTFIVAVPFELEEVNRRAYLQDLIIFAGRRVQVNSAGLTLSQQLLTETFNQPFDRLADPDSLEVANAAARPVHQIRICIEVLRRLINAVSPEAESLYRASAYQALLRNLGTSYEEIRLARVAESDSRKAVADRLGITLGVSRPDPLDRMFLPPERLATAHAEADLEGLFGLVDTQPERDPLQLPKESKLLQWRLAHLRASWRHQDHSIDASTVETTVPIIDPDLVGESDLADATPTNAAYDILEEREAWVAGMHESMRSQREARGNPLEGFDHIINTSLGPIDLEALADEREQGSDIEEQLHRHYLRLDAFLYLVGLRRLASAGTVLNEEWEDVYSILVQVLKRRDKYPLWREEERAKDLTLSPDYFRLAGADGSSSPLTPDLRRWRASWRIRRMWERTLEARIKQKEAIRESLLAVVDATEEATLPLLRDALVATVHTGDEDVDIANWLTQRMQIDVKSRGNQRITRIQQAIATLQGVLFSLRTERFATMQPLLGPILPAEWKLALVGEYTERKFDQEWRWMGAYETWRAAMFVFGYPENYLLPTLREHHPPTRTQQKRSGSWFGSCEGARNSRLNRRVSWPELISEICVPNSDLRFLTHSKKMWRSHSS